MPGNCDVPVSLCPSSQERCPVTDDDPLVGSLSSGSSTGAAVNRPAPVATETQVSVYITETWTRALARADQLCVLIE